MSFPILLSVQQAIERLDDPQMVVLDTRYALQDPDYGLQQYAQSRIPGAWYVNPGTDLVTDCTGKNGRHPLPEVSAFTALLADLGFTKKQQYLIYDDNSGQFGARLWWMLRWAGYEQVALLDGGWQAWLAHHGPLSQEVADGLRVSRAWQCIAGKFSQTKQAAMPTRNREELLAQLNDPDLCIIDARAAERYRGEVEPLDPIAGHIPGALNRPTALNLQADGRFKSAVDLRAEFQHLIKGYEPYQVVHQCGSGMTACHNLFAMELAGLSGSALYPGSWSEWVAYADAPIESLTD